MLQVYQHKKLWTEEEDDILRKAVNQVKSNNWSEIAKVYENLSTERLESTSYRTGKQCRERWHNKLSPSLQNINEKWAEEEEEALLRIYAECGHRWVKIVDRLQGEGFARRSDNSIKNHFHILIKKAVKELNEFIEQFNRKVKRSKVYQDGKKKYVYNRIYSIEKQLKMQQKQRQRQQELNEDSTPHQIDEEREQSSLSKQPHSSVIESENRANSEEKWGQNVEAPKVLKKIEKKHIDKILLWCDEKDDTKLEIVRPVANEELLMAKQNLLSYLQGPGEFTENGLRELVCQIQNTSKCCKKANKRTAARKIKEKQKSANLSQPKIQALSQSILEKLQSRISDDEMMTQILHHEAQMYFEMICEMVTKTLEKKHLFGEQIGKNSLIQKGEEKEILGAVLDEIASSKKRNLRAQEENLKKSEGNAGWNQRQKDLKSEPKGDEGLFDVFKSAEFEPIPFFNNGPSVAPGNLNESQSKMDFGIEKKQIKKHSSSESQKLFDSVSLPFQRSDEKVDMESHQNNANEGNGGWIWKDKGHFDASEKSNEIYKSIFRHLPPEEIRREAELERIKRSTQILAMSSDLNRSQNLNKSHDSSAFNLYRRPNQGEEFRKAPYQSPFQQGMHHVLSPEPVPVHPTPYQPSNNGNFQGFALNASSDMKPFENLPSLPTHQQCKPSPAGFDINNSEFLKNIKEEPNSSGLYKQPQVFNFNSNDCPTGGFFSSIREAPPMGFVTYDLNGNNEGAVSMEIPKKLIDSARNPGFPKTNYNDYSEHYQHQKSQELFNSKMFEFENKFGFNSARLSQIDLFQSGNEENHPQHLDSRRSLSRSKDQSYSNMFQSQKLCQPLDVSGSLQQPSGNIPIGGSSMSRGSSRSKHHNHQHLSRSFAYSSSGYFKRDGSQNDENGLT